MKTNLYIIILLFGIILSGTNSRSQTTPDLKSDIKSEEKFTVNEAHKKFAVSSNNLVWQLLEKNNRTADEDETMINTAYASLYHWSVIGKPVNLQRGQWLISHVYAVLKRPEPALHHAKKCMELSEQFNIDDFDLAYAYEGMARALAAAGNSREWKKWYEQAEQAGGQINDKEDRGLFLSDLINDPWFGLK